MKKIIFFIIVASMVFSLCACDSGNSPNTEPLPSESIRESNSDLKKEEHVHDYGVKSVADAYFKAEATYSAPATYYYSCKCGQKGKSTFEYGDKLSGWRTVSKTVYAMANAYLHTTAEDDRNFCEHLTVGAVYKVTSTDGEWYKVEYPYLQQGSAYVMCKYVTDNVDDVTFDALEEACPAYIKDDEAGIYLCNGLDESSGVFIDRELVNSDYMDIISVNRSKTWVKVLLYGADPIEDQGKDFRYYYVAVKHLGNFGIS